MNINLKSIKTQKEWLELFAKIGEEAQSLLAGEESHPTPWSELAMRFFSDAFPPVPSASRTDYGRWIASLAEFATTKGIPTPADMTARDADAMAGHLVARNISPARRYRFYKRVWRTLGMDDLIWNSPKSLVQIGTEHYRRLTAKELETLFAFARKEDPDAADMMEIGYWTALRLSDVSHLEQSEVRLDIDALVLIPNKVRTRKPHPLTIPLVGGALSTVRRRISSLHGGRYLFAERCQLRPSRRISKLFAATGITKQGGGRASFHSLRATFISLMDEAGVQPYITDAITGHSNGGMHARYTQPSLEIMRSAIGRAIPEIGGARSQSRSSRRWSLRRHRQRDAADDVRGRGSA